MANYNIFNNILFIYIYRNNNRNLKYNFNICVPITYYKLICSLLNIFKHIEY